MKKSTRQKRPTRSSKNLPKAKIFHPDTGKEVWQPSNSQLEGVSLMTANGAAGILFDPGLGKTSVAMTAFCLMLERGMVDEVLVIAPLRPCYSTWPNELAKWHEFRHLTHAIVHGKDLEANLLSDAHVKLMNPEGLAQLVSVEMIHRPGRKPRKKVEVTPLARKYFSGRRVILIVDESTKFKKSNNHRHERIKKILNHFARRYIMTGSPIPNGLMDLFGQVYILDQGHALGAYVTHYRNAYFYSTGFGGHTYIPHHDAGERIFDTLEGVVLRKSAADELDLPPIITVDVPVDLPDKIFEQYIELESELVAEIAGRKTIVKNAGHRVIACRQISNGGLYRAQDYAISEDGFLIKEPREWDELHDVKVQAVCDIVEELSGRGALVAYEFQHDLKRLKAGLKKLLGKEPPHIGKGVSPKRSAEIEREWNAGDHPVLLLHPDSAAHGINLQGFGHAVIFASMIYNLEHYEQLIRRLCRQGLHEGVDRVIVHRILGRGTVDYDAAAAVDAKDDFQRSFLHNLQQRIAAVEIDDDLTAKYNQKGDNVNAILIMFDGATGALLYRWDSLAPPVVDGGAVSMHRVADSIAKRAGVADLVIVTQKRHLSTLNAKKLKRLYKDLSGKATKLRTFEDLVGALWKFLNPSNVDIDAAFPGQGGALITQDAPAKVSALRKVPKLSAQQRGANPSVCGTFFSLFEDHRGKSGIRARNSVLKSVRAAYPLRVIPDAYFGIYLARWSK